MMSRVLCTKNGKKCIGQYLCAEGRRYTGPCPYMRMVWLVTTTVGVRETQTTSRQTYYTSTTV